EQRSAKVLTPPGDFCDQWRVDTVITPTKVAKSGIIDVVEVIVDRVWLRAEAVLDTFSFEIGLHAGSGHLGVESGKHKAPPLADDGERLGEKCSKVLKVLRYQGTEKSVKPSVPQGEVAVQIRLRKGNARYRPLRDPEHTP